MTTSELILTFIRTFVHVNTDSKKIIFTIKINNLFLQYREFAEASDIDRFSSGNFQLQYLLFVMKYNITRRFLFFYSLLVLFFFKSVQAQFDCTLEGPFYCTGGPILGIYFGEDEGDDTFGYYATVNSSCALLQGGTYEVTDYTIEVRFEKNEEECQITGENPSECTCLSTMHLETIEIRKKEEKARRTQKVMINLAKAEDERRKSSEPPEQRKRMPDF